MGPKQDELETSLIFTQVLCAWFALRQFLNLVPNLFLKGAFLTAVYELPLEVRVALGSSYGA